MPSGNPNRPAAPEDNVKGPILVPFTVEKNPSAFRDKLKLLGSLGGQGLQLDIFLADMGRQPGPNKFQKIIGRGQWI